MIVCVCVCVLVYLRPHEEAVQQNRRKCRREIHTGDKPPPQNSHNGISRIKDRDNNNRGRNLGGPPVRTSVTQDPYSLGTE